MTVWVGVGVNVDVWVDVGLSDGIGVLGGLIVKVKGSDVPPPGVGLKIITFAVPAEAISAAGMEAVSCVSLT